MIDQSGPRTGEGVCPNTIHHACPLLTPVDALGRMRQRGTQDPTQQARPIA
ncbi:MAG: hypothetical protein IPO87_13820 [Flavobacteriales bacterium]|nr:hypothetical protein [Flavobacteriales bacterium]